MGAVSTGPVVLIVDDHQPERKLYAQIVTREGYEV